MTRKDLSNLMHRAWAIARATGKCFSVALAKAWELYRLTKRMREGIVRFAYEKADGTIRKALGTLKDTAVLVKGDNRSDNGKAFKYYDTEAQGFRSFKVENLIAIY